MPVGHAMWGGRRPEDVGEPRAVAVAETPPQAPPVMGVPTRPLFSLALVVLGAILLSVGMGLILGVGGALIGAGLVVLLIGIMLGMGDEP